MSDVRDPEFIRIQGARQHNLKNISLSLPRNRLIVITGPSGSGKSSLAFDTLFAEGQRRYVESLSSYARQFLDQMEKPDVDFIEGLSPAVAIEQRTSSPTPRSTIATTTEIYDYLRVLYSACGRPHHPATGRPLVRYTIPQIVDRILTEPPGTPFLLLAPVVRNEKGTLRDVLERLRKDGYVRARIDGSVVPLDQPVKLDKATPHTIEAVIDRLKIADGIRARLNDSVELALRVGQGVLTVAWPDPVRPDWTLSNENFDPETGYRFPTFTPRHFSFNSPLGACPECHGLGTIEVLDPALIVPDPTRTLLDNPIGPWRRQAKRFAGLYLGILRDLARHAGVPCDVPWQDLPAPFHHLVLHGSDGVPVAFTTVRNGEITVRKKPFEGVLAQVRHLYDTAKSPLSRARIRTFMSRSPCPACQGSRLRPEVLAVTLESQDGRRLNIDAFTRLSISEALAFLDQLSWSRQEETIAHDVLREIRARLSFLLDVGLGYLTLARETHTLSGGEAQRIRLATQIGSGLTGVLYILDEPSIGLHPRDQQRLLSTLTRLRDLGNTVVVVEHDEATIRCADYIVDIGPGAGRAGGEVVAAGTLDEILAHPKSPTGRFLSGRSALSVPKRRTPTDRGWLTVRNASEHNLQNIDAAFPLGCLTCVTGASGSGKSTLVNDILCRALMRHFHGSKDQPGRHRAIEGLAEIDKVVVIDQEPIGRTPRSNPLTYTGAFNGIRDLFAQLPSSRVRGYSASRFSFNTPGGRCEHCEGDGYRRIEMNFLPDVYVPCEVCKGDRFNRETLEITYKGHNIADVLRLTVDEGCTLFKNVPGVSDRLEALSRVGLGYLPMGQSATSLSGGEAQRIKLAAELARRATGRTVFILDEPTTGLHFGDIEQLLAVLFTLRDAGNTVIVIEHQLDVIKSADYIIDLGPDGGAGGGRIVAQGTPEEVAAQPGSCTGRFLAPLLRSSPVAPRATHEATLL
jgi:excinuclease ABC subunit A